MKNTKLLKILSSLNASEIRKLKEFVHSPYFNKNKKIQDLLVFLLQFYPQFYHPDLTDENAFELVFGEEQYKEQAITKISSKLYQLIFQFIQIEMFNEKGVQENLAVLRFLNQKDLMQEYHRHLKKVKKELESSIIQDSEFFYHQFLVEQEVNYLRAAKPNSEVGLTMSYQVSVDYLDKFYLVTKLNYLCHQINHEQTSHISDYQLELLEELENYIPTSPYFDTPSIRAWFTVLQLLRSADKQTYYFKLKEQLFEHYRKLNSFDIRNIFSNLINNARFIFQDKNAYYAELFELYNFQYERGLLKQTKLLSAKLFINIITIGILNGNLAWAENFLNEFHDYSKNREDDVNNLCAAMIAFERKDFSKALDHLNVCKLRNTYLKLSERRMRLKVYFEVQYFDLIDDTINSFRKFLSTNKKIISELHLEANRNFVNFLNHVFYLSDLDKEKISQVTEEVNQAQVLPEKRWLMEKIENLNK